MSREGGGTASRTCIARKKNGYTASTTYLSKPTPERKKKVVFGLGDELIRLLFTVQYAKSLRLSSPVRPHALVCSARGLENFRLRGGGVTEMRRIPCDMYPIAAFFFVQDNAISSSPLLSVSKERKDIRREEQIRTEGGPEKAGEASRLAFSHPQKPNGSPLPYGIDVPKSKS